MKYKQILFSIVLTVISSTTYAQTMFKYWEVGGSLGISNYNGNFSASTANFPVGQLSSFVHNDLGISAFAQYHFHPSLSIRPQVSYLRIWARDRDSKDSTRVDRNGGFRADLFEVSGVLVWDFLATSNNYKSRPNFTPYIFAGLGFTYGRGTGSPGIDVGQVRGVVKNYTTTAVVVPFGGGVKYRLRERWNIFAELAVRWSSTNYLDNYATIPDLPNNPPTKSKYDWYTYTNIGVSYIIFDRDQCPKPKSGKKKRFLLF